MPQLDIAQWAWEFLRRNPDYRADYASFIAIWQALETDYGKPPHRDFHRWKADPRASRPAWSPELTTGTACAADDDNRQLIECWMGAKWGFYQFPQDPAIPAWELEAPINWRPAPGYRVDGPAEGDMQVSLRFDLSCPLPAQLEAARLWLVGKQAALRRQGRPAPATPDNRRAHWTALLAALDSASGPLLNEAQHMCRRGYREILRLAPMPRQT